MPRAFRPTPLALLSVLALSSSCASSRNVRPLGQGNVAGHVSLGGPLVGLGGDSHGPAIVIPTPILEQLGVVGKDTGGILQGTGKKTKDLFKGLFDSLEEKPKQ